MNKQLLKHLREKCDKKKKQSFFLFFLRHRTKIIFLNNKFAQNSAQRWKIVKIQKIFFWGGPARRGKEKKIFIQGKDSLISNLNHDRQILKRV